MLTIPKGQQWSQYQLDIFTQFQQMSKGETMVIDASAGSGKSSTIVAMAQLLNEKGLFVAFNKSIATELGEKLKGTSMKASTVHSLGMGALRYHWRKEWGNPEVEVDVESEKYRRFILRYMEPHKEKIHEFAKRMDEDPDRVWLNTIRDFVRILDLVRLNLIDPTDLEAINKLCKHHGMMPFFMGIIGPGIDLAIKYGEKCAKQKTKVEVDFTDMIYLPNKWNLSLFRYNNVFVDEAQDLNPAQRGIVFKVSSRYGKTVYVGDASQAINGWCGADAESFAFIKRYTKAKVLPLSICYRCPKKVIELAQILVPTIEPRPDAPDGEILFEDENRLPELVTKGDVIVGRKTADLVKWCLKLIVAGVSAKVLGTDIGEGLIKVLTTIKKAQRDAFRYGDFETYVDQWEAQQLARLKQMGADEPVINAVMDKCEALRVCIELINARDFDGLVAGIRDLFSNEQSPIVFMTIHKAKGLEADRVFILSPQDLPLRWSGQLYWQSEQEKNLLYVAITRAKQTLVFLGDLPPILETKPVVEEPELVQVASDTEVATARFTITDWHAYAGIDTGWCADTYSGPPKSGDTFVKWLNRERRKQGRRPITITRQKGA